MRIAIVTTSYPARAGDPGGHFVRADARDLERRGHDVVVIAPPTGGAFGWPGVAARVRERPHRAVDAAAWVARAALEVARARADHIVAHWALPSAWPIAAAGRRGASTLEVVSHGGDVRLLLALPTRARAHIARAIAARAERWTFVSRPLRDTLVEALPERARDAVAKIAEIRAPLLELPDVSARIQERRAALGTRRVAVSVGRLVPSKRVDRAIDHAANGAYDTLVVVGDGPERPNLERRARARAVDALFVGTVHRDEALTWIGAADALIHASEAEGLSTVIREAEALGTRVVRLP